MWIRKCYLDAKSDIQSPIPNRIFSNEEFIPPPQSAQQQEVENRLRVMADRNAKLLGLSRRQFLQIVPGAERGTPGRDDERAHRRVIRDLG